MFDFISNAYNAVHDAVVGPAQPAPHEVAPVHHDPAPAPHPAATPAPAPSMVTASAHAAGPQVEVAVGPPGLADPNGAPPSPNAAPDPVQMQAAATQLFRAMDGWGTDEDAIHNALRGRSPAEIAAIRSVYADHFPGHNLDNDIAGEVSGNDLAEAQAQLTADPVQASVATLRNASEGMGTNEDAIHATLAGIHDPAVRAQVAAEFSRQTGTSLDAMLADELSGGDLAISQHEATGDTVGANAARIDDAMNGGFLGLGLGTDEDAVYTALEGCHTPEERAALAAAYQTQTGRAMSADINNEMSDADLDVATSLQSGDRAGAAAARMQVAADGLGTDEDAIFRTLSSARDPQEREAMIASYNERYGSAHGGQDFNAMITGELGDMDATRAQQLATNGKMDPAFALRYAMDGIGTDEDMLRETLRGRSPADIAVIREQYRAQFGADLDSEISGENSGRDGFEITQMMLGEPQTPQDQIARLNAAYDFERGSGAGLIGNFVMDNLAGSDAGRVLDAQHARIAELDARISAGTATAEDMARLQTVGNYQRDDVQSYQAVQDSATNALATGATIAVGAIVTVATAGTAAPAVIAAVAALAGGTAGMITKGLMLGGSYSDEQMGIDAVQTIASAVTAGTLKMDSVGQIFSRLAAVNPAGAQTLMEAVRLGAVYGAAGGISSGVVSGALDERTWRGPGNGFANFLGTVGTSTATGIVSGAAGGATGHAYNERYGIDPNDINLGGVQATSTIGGMLSGATGSFAQTSTELAITAATHGGEIGSLDSVLQRYGQSMAGGTISGGADGYAMGVYQQQELARRAALAADTPAEGGATTEAAPTVAARAAHEDGAPATLENTLPLVEAAVDAPDVAPPTRTVETAPPIAEQVLAPVVDGPTPVIDTPEGRYDHAVYSKETSGNSPAHNDVLALASLATSADDYRFILAEAERTGVTLSPERRRILETAASGGDTVIAQQSLVGAGDREALRDLHIEARLAGPIDPQSGEILRQFSQEQGLDQMPFVEAMNVHGFDPVELQQLYNRANVTDSSPSIEPGSSIHRDHQDNDLGRVGRTPGAMTESDVSALFDIAGMSFDDLHTGLPTGQQATPIRKAVPPSSAADTANGGTERYPIPMMTGDVGPHRNTMGQGPGQMAGTLGLDYKSDNNVYFDADTNSWRSWVTTDGMPVVQTPLNPDLYSKMQVPLGSDAATMFGAEANRRVDTGEYVPELMRRNADGDLPHIMTRERADQSDPKTGWGFSTTERADQGVTPNLESTLSSPHPYGPGSQVINVNGDGTETRFAQSVPTDDGSAKPSLWRLLEGWF